MTCPDAEPLIGRYADDPAALGRAERQQLEGHLAACEACRLLLEDQRHVARVLHARPQASVLPTFAARLSARLDAEPKGMLALANWRALTVALAAPAAALVLIAWLGGSPATPTVSSSTSQPADTFAALTEPSPGSGPAEVFLQSSSEGLIEAVLTGAPQSAGETNGR
jgi:predicted anti-sigma-YlaC factor YlaD